MRKTLLAVFICTGAFAGPGFAQVSAGGAGQAGTSAGTVQGQAQTGTSAGIGASTSTGASVDGTSKPPLGLGSLIQDPMTTMQEPDSAAEPANGPEKNPLGREAGSRTKPVPGGN